MDIMKLCDTLNHIRRISDRDIVLTPANSDSKYDSTRLETRAGVDFTGNRLEEAKPTAGKPFPSLHEQLGIVEPTEDMTEDMKKQGYSPVTVFTYEDVKGIPGLAVINSYNSFIKPGKMSVDPKKSYNPEELSRKNFYVLVPKGRDICVPQKISEFNDGGYLNAERIAKNKFNANKRGVD